jgi:hypothetical protein
MGAKNKIIYLLLLYTTYIVNVKFYKSSNIILIRSPHLRNFHKQNYNFDFLFSNDFKVIS